MMFGNHEITSKAMVRHRCTLYIELLKHKGLEYFYKNFQSFLIFCILYFNKYQLLNLFSLRMVFLLLNQHKTLHLMVII